MVKKKCNSLGKKLFGLQRVAPHMGKINWWPPASLQESSPEISILVFIRPCSSPPPKVLHVVAAHGTSKVACIIKQGLSSISSNFARGIEVHQVLPQPLPWWSLCILLTMFLVPHLGSGVFQPDPLSKCDSKSNNQNRQWLEP